VFAHHVARGASNYFLGSPSLMLALALYEHDSGQPIRQIDSWGIDTSDPQHGQQRQSWSYWLAQAHARGIETGGTSCGYMAEPERDAGLAGLREQVGDYLQDAVQAPGHKNYVVASYATSNEPYLSHAARLQDECAALGLECDVTMLPARPAGEPWKDSILHCQRIGQTILDGLNKHGRPVIYMDADDHIVKAPTLPDGLDVGMIRNQERQHYEPRGLPYLPMSQVCAFAPTEAARAALALVLQMEAHVTGHRALNGLWAAMERTGTVKDISAHFRGCIEQTPNRSRTTVCKT
jgi:hypothetical protein